MAFFMDGTVEGMDDARSLANVLINLSLLLLSPDPRKKKKLAANRPFFANVSAIVWAMADFPDPM
jgi:hypothetical protein